VNDSFPTAFKCFRHLVSYVYMMTDLVPYSVLFKDLITFLNSGKSGQKRPFERRRVDGRTI
jgi:hypothetical protein